MTTKLATAALAIMSLAAASCGRPASNGAATLAAARRGFTTHLLRRERSDDPVDAPPPQLLQLVRYPSKVGDLSAYLSPDPGDGHRHPAIIWIFGGFDNGIGDTAWKPATPDNDQSARAFREAGLVMMYPSLRGGNGNPGYKEMFYGEADDVLSALDYLAKQPFVDPQRIYLGGHSTGGTLALLVAEMTDRFRAVFSLGPVGDIRGYGEDKFPFDTSRQDEVKLRSPREWLTSIRTPTYVLEGDQMPSNLDSVERMAGWPHNSKVRFFSVTGVDHFSNLAFLTPVLAGAAIADTGPTADFHFANRAISEL